MAGWGGTWVGGWVEAAAGARRGSSEVVLSGGCDAQQDRVAASIASNRAAPGVSQVTKRVALTTARRPAKA